MGRARPTSAVTTPDLVREAARLHRIHHEALAAHPRIPELLQNYRRAIENTGRLTVELGLPAVCAACAARKANCCSRGLEDQYDTYLLLINLLMGATPNQEPEVEGDCLFCGPGGCRLIAKNSYCLNFFCPEIKEKVGKDAVGALLGLVGRELLCQWELERELAPWLEARRVEGAGPEK